jgi:hypothetical protein
MRGLPQRKASGEKATMSESTKDDALTPNPQPESQDLEAVGSNPPEAAESPPESVAAEGCRTSSSRERGFGKPSGVHSGGEPHSTRPGFGGGT